MRFNEKCTEMLRLEHGGRGAIPRLPQTMLSRFYTSLSISDLTIVQSPVTSI